ncbi:hypothetical protein BH23GEM9_BH23GEM9_06010 [soil metagenome]
MDRRVDWIELPPGRRRRGSLERVGMSPHQRRRFIDAVVHLLVVLFAVAWLVTIVHAVLTNTPRPGLAAGIATNPLAADAPTPAAFVLDAALRQFTERAAYRGRSGQVQVIVHEPGEPVPFVDDALPGVAVEYVTDTGDTIRSDGGTPPPGLWNVLLRARNQVRRVPDLAVLSMVPMAEKRSGRIGSYIIGSWPHESGGTPRSPAYAAPRGMVRVTPENLDLPVSRHFRLRHFVTKGQENVWPKYVLISPRLLDKLELTIDELNRSGVRVERVGVVSGFRTPSYNSGGGDTAGRGALSRHMYGDAMDWFVDNDGDGRMDDLNGDGRIDIEDGRVIAAAAERVERRYPDLVGGIGVYRPTGAHSGFVHIDTRGYRARW